MSEIPINQIICGDAITELKKLPDESIQMVMTSPPYYGLRDYKIDNQLGLEKTPQLYLERLWSVFDEVKRVLKKDGVVFVNLGDTYGGNKIGKTDKKVSDYLKEQQIGIVKKVPGFEKSLLMIPEKFALGMIERGWILRNRICWFKRNAMPSSVKDRFTCTWEYVYFFSKSQRYYFDLDSVRQPLRIVTLERYNRNYGSPDNKYNDQDPKVIGGAKIDLRPKEYWRKSGVSTGRNNPNTKIGQLYRNKTADQSYKTGGMRARPEPNDPKYKNMKYYGNKEVGGQVRDNHDIHKCYHLLGKNPGDHWDITTRGYKGAHFAVYPEELCLMPIKTGSRPRDIVLDCFAGSCTTCLVAKKLGRNYIGIDLNPDYVKMGEKRILEECGSLF